MIEELIIGGCLAAALSTSAAMAAMVDAKSVVATYSDIVFAGYSDALSTANALDAAVDALIANPPSLRRSQPRKAPGRRRTFPISSPKLSVSAMPSSTIGKAA